MDQQTIQARQQPWQFNLGSLLIAVVFVALACTAGKNSVLLMTPGPLDSCAPVLWLFPIPVALCGAIGVLRGNLKSWLVFGVMIDLVVTVVFVAIAGLAVICFMVSMARPKA